MNFLKVEDFSKIKRLLVLEKDALSLVILWQEYMIFQFRDSLAKDSTLLN
jgi:hypothetical protein